MILEFLDDSISNLTWDFKKMIYSCVLGWGRKSYSQISAQGSAPSSVWEEPFSARDGTLAPACKLCTPTYYAVSPPCPKVMFTEEPINDWSVFSKTLWGETLYSENTEWPHLPYFFLHIPQTEKLSNTVPFLLKFICVFLFLVGKCWKEK